MRPDYTVTLWPEALSEVEAELAERIVHLHFDAKYRIAGLSELFGNDSIEEDDEPSEDSVAAAAIGEAKREDLLKMHAYRDAIRRSISAFVLYPGAEDRKWRAVEEIVPGLGAIAIVPGDLRGRRTVADFLCAAVDLLTPNL